MFSVVCVVGCGFLSPAVTGYRRLRHIHGSAVWSNTTPLILRSGFMIKLQSSMSKHIPVSETFQHKKYLCFEANSGFNFVVFTLVSICELISTGAKQVLLSTTVYIYINRSVLFCCNHLQNCTIVCVCVHKDGI